MKILVVGHLTRDRFGDNFALGGSVLYCANVYKELGADVTVVTTAGPEIDAIIPGVRVISAPSPTTTVFENEYDVQGNRTQWVEARANDIVPPDDLQESFDVVHLAPVLGEVDASLWAHRYAPAMVVLGVQGWTRELVEEDGRQKVVAKNWDLPADARVDVACLSDEDIANAPDLLARLRQRARQVCFTHGIKGAELFEGTREYHIPAFPTPNTVDPTGAGDVFAAAFVHELARGTATTSAGRIAAACGSIVVEGQGPSALGRLGEARDRARDIIVKNL